MNGDGRSDLIAGAPSLDGAYLTEGAAYVYYGLPTYLVNDTGDGDDGFCTIVHCTLREAINAVNAIDGPGTREIDFDFATAPPYVIAPGAALPTLTRTVRISISYGPGILTLDGSDAGGAGLVVAADGSAVAGLDITGFSGDGLVLNSSNAEVANNAIHGNGGAGVAVLSGAGNTISSNLIFDNGGLGIDLGNDGVTPNDVGDADAGPNSLLNSPTITRATSDATQTTIEWSFSSAPLQTFLLHFYASPACDPAGYGEGMAKVGEVVAAVPDGGGNAIGLLTIPGRIDPPNSYVTALALDAYGNTSEFSNCRHISRPNGTWTTALRLDPERGARHHR